MIRARVLKRFPAEPESPGFRLDIDLEAGPGVTILYGASGSGKTLTLDSLAGFVTPDRGRILVNDRILFDAEAHVNLRPQQRACGYVFQNYALFPHMTLRENLVFAANSLGHLERHRRIGELLERFQISELSGRYPHELSGGQKQRGSIARALIRDPQVLLLDEPARGLDSALRSDLYSLLLELRATFRIPILLVTHDLDECFALGENVLIYDAGEIVQSGSPVELLQDPGSETVARLLGDFNVFDAEILSLDPGRHTSRLGLLGQEMTGPYLPGCFRGDRIAVCARPEEMRVATQPGENRVRADVQRTMDRPQSIRVDFGHNLVVDLPRETWRDLQANGKRGGWWVEIPAENLRRLGVKKSLLSLR